MSTGLFSSLRKENVLMVSIIRPGAEQQTRSITDLYKTVRARTMQIVAPLEIEDYVIQTAEFMSPPRWHIGHTSWFFETVLQAHKPGYKVYSEEYLFYFNSYYEGFGERIARPKRGTRSRPTVRDTVAYRRHVDEQILQFLDSVSGNSNAETVLALIRLGLEHEMQHQELLVYDIKHLLCDQYQPHIKTEAMSSVKVEGMAEIEGGLFWLGYGALRGSPTPGHVGQPGLTVTKGVNQSGDESPPSKNYDFAFDNEKPAHQVFMQAYALDHAPVSNGEYLEFIRAGGYQDYRWWFSEGWEAVNREQWRAPLYWELHDGKWMIRDFSGLHLVESKENEPVYHVSYFEASAFAKWAGKRLPTEAEWEKAACFRNETGERKDFPWGNERPDEAKANLFENGLWTVAPIGAFSAGQNSYGCHQMIGDVWEWTTSDYVPYPGFKSEFDEYNDKWFVNQKVLRGGSFATPQSHIRSTYRNFFHAHERWMISGLRCAKDI
jgi:formylglycine-generating enzyme required for sulfatase activity